MKSQRVPSEISVFVVLWNKDCRWCIIACTGAAHAYMTTVCNFISGTFHDFKSGHKNTASHKYNLLYMYAAHALTYMHEDEKEIPMTGGNERH